MTPLPLAKEIMVTKLTTVGPEDDVLRGIRLLLHHRITGAPVVKSDRTYLGMLSEGSCMRVLFLTAREAGPETRQAPKAREFMSKKLLTLRPESDAVDAISTLLKHRFSGAPVVDEDLNFLGVFSERYIMRLLINSAYEQLPSTPVKAFMNTDRGRLIEEDTDLLVVARMFLDTYYRRLPVLRDGKLVGQVSRRDVLKAEHHLARFVKGRRRALLDHRRGSVLGEVWHSDGRRHRPRSPTSWTPPPRRSTRGWISWRSHASSWTRIAVASRSCAKASWSARSAAAIYFSRFSISSGKSRATSSRASI